MKPPTQQELNVRFAKVLGWKGKPNDGLIHLSDYSPPNYFAPENFYLVRAAVSKNLSEQDQDDFISELSELCGASIHSNPVERDLCLFLSPVEHIITAYLKVKEVN